MSLLQLPAEMQKAILTTLDYASLCQIRSTGRYFYNMLTEPEIHDVFLNISIPQGDYVFNVTQGQTCAGCAGHCDATISDEEGTSSLLKDLREKTQKARDTLTEAIEENKAAKKVLRKAKAGVKAAEKAPKSKKDQKEKRATVIEAEVQARSTNEAVKAAQLELQTKQRTQDDIPLDVPNLARTCHSCKRKFNGYKAPGLLYSNPSSSHDKLRAVKMACSRFDHFERGQTYDKYFEAMQKDGKICNICWKSGRRGAAGIQRRRAFIEEFGYWLRYAWLREGEAIQIRGAKLADKSFEDIVKEKEEADNAKALLKMKAEADDEGTS